MDSSFCLFFWRNNFLSPPGKGILMAGDICEYDICQYVSFNAQSQPPVPDYASDSCSGPVNSSYERARTQSFACIRALIHTHVDAGRRLKRSPASIALAINALSASAAPFCLSLQNARFRIIDADVPPVDPSRFHYSADSSGWYFFWRRRVFFTRRGSQ